MLKFSVAIIESTFREDMEWTGRKVTPIEPPEGAMGAWLLEDRFSNAWTILSTKTAGEYIVEGKDRERRTPFSVRMQLLGDQVGIVDAIDDGRRVESEKSFKKYMSLGFIVSGLFSFGMLKMQNPSAI